MNLNSFVVSLFFILSGVDGPGASDGTVSTPVTVKVGDDATLSCDLKTRLNLIGLAVEWKYNGTKVHFYRSRGDDLRGQGEMFKGRTSLFPDEMKKGNFSLKLTNVTETHEGDYTCKVRNRGQLKSCRVTLIVTHGGDTDESLGGDAGMSTGGIVGSVVGPIVGAALLFAAVGLVYLCYKKQHAREGRVPVPDRDDSPDNNLDANSNTTECHRKRQQLVLGMLGAERGREAVPPNDPDYDHDDNQQSGGNRAGQQMNQQLVLDNNSGFLDPATNSN